MSRVAAPSGEKVLPTPRRCMTPARKLKIWTRELGRCYLCDTYCPIGEAEIEHPESLWMGGPDEDDALRVVHAETCHVKKTAVDAKDRAKVKRIIAREDGTRRPRAKIQSPGFRKGVKVKWPKQSNRWKP